MFWLSLFPVATGFMGENHVAPTPSALYGVVWFGAAISYTILQMAIIRSQGKESLLHAAVGSDWKGKVSLVFYVVGIASTLVVPFVAEVFYVAVALVWLVPDRRIERTLAQQES